MNTRPPEPPPNTMGQARVVLVVLAAGVVTGAIWLFIWAWQLGSPVLVLFGVVCLPMGLVLVYGAVLACQRSDTPRVEHILQERRRLRSGWASDTPRHLSRYEPAQPLKEHPHGWQPSVDNARGTR